MLKAFLGTAIGDHVERAIERKFPGAIRQASVTLALEGSERTFEVPGHPDLILPDEGIVLDAKTSDGLSLARRLGADQQKNFQRHGYGKAAWAAGMFGDRPLEEVQVGNVWIDRSGDTQEVHVQLVPFDQQVLDDASRWLEDVIYAYINGEEARKEPAREVCAVTCGFFSVCREWDTDVEGLLTDPEVVEAIRMYREGAALEKQGRSLKAEAKPALKDIAGSTGDTVVRWIHVNETTVPATKRAAYSRLDIKPVKRGK